MPPLPKAIKLAILDDYQDIAPPHFECLKPQFDITVHNDTLLPYTHPSSTPDIQAQIVARLKPYTVIASMRERTPFPADLLSKLPNLKLLLNSGSRNKGIDMDAATKLGIRVTGAEGRGRSTATPSKKARGPDSTTQHCVTLILALARNIAHDDKVVKAGGWETVLATGLAGKTLGLVGLGRLGVNVGKILHSSFGMNVIAWSSSLTQEKADDAAAGAGLPVEDEDGAKTFKAVSKEELFTTADVVSLHLVLGDRSRGVVAAPELQMMKKSALLINTSRGPLIVEEDLLAVCEAGGIRGVALDVFDTEPLGLDSRWRSQEWGSGLGGLTGGKSMVLLSPHMGYVEEDTMHAFYEEQVENCERWVRGEELRMVLA